MVTALDFGSSGPGSSPGRGHCVVFLGKTRNSHSASLYPGVLMGIGEFYAEGNSARWTSISFMYVCKFKETGISSGMVSPLAHIEPFCNLVETKFTK